MDHKNTKPADVDLLFDEKTDTTRWMLYRHPETKQLTATISQEVGGIIQVVTVSVNNLRVLLDDVVPTLEIEKSEPAIEESEALNTKL